MVISLRRFFGWASLSSGWVLSSVVFVTCYSLSFVCLGDPLSCLALLFFVSWFCVCLGLFFFFVFVSFFFLFCLCLCALFVLVGFAYCCADESFHSDDGAHVPAENAHGPDSGGDG